MLDADARPFLHGAAARLEGSAPSFDRVLRTARTIADRQAASRLPPIAEAIQHRRELPTA